MSSTSTDPTGQPPDPDATFGARGYDGPLELGGERWAAVVDPSAFFGTPMVSRLRTLGVDNVAIFGCMTSGCVRASAVDAFSYGFGLAVVEDGCGDQDETTHRHNLRDVGRRYGTVLRGADLVRTITLGHEPAPPPREETL